MLHGTNISRQGSAALTVLIGLLATIVTPAAAHALTRPTPPPTANTVRLVQHADGSLNVVTGAQFDAVDPTATVVAEGPDVTFSTTLLAPIDEVVDQATGLINDELRADQWGLDALSAEAAWTVADGAGQVIAIVDSGVDGAHPDLSDQLVDGFSAIGEDELVDGHGHGTHVAGTAAATAGDTFGVAGLAPGAEIMPVQVTDPDGVAYASDVAEGLIWAVDHGATVANLSLAGTQESTVLNAAIDYAVDNGVVVVVAAGNEFRRDNPRTYPASHPEAIAVGAMRDSETRSSFSSSGDFVDLAAPGSAILSDRPDGAFGYASGTSMASPMVAGAVAMLRSTDADLTVEEVRDVLTQTARDVGIRGRDDYFGHGALDLLAALEQVIPGTAGLDSIDDLLEETGDGQAAETGEAHSEENGEVGDTPTTAADPITQTIDDGSWVSQGWGLG